MSTFSCPVVRVSSVEDHKNADRLSIVKMEGLGYTCISGKLDDGSPRYKVGDFVVYIPSASVLPEWLLKSMDFWNEETGKGFLSGADGNIVRPKRLRGIFSEGVLFPITFVADEDGHDGDYWLTGENEDHVLPSHHVNGVFGPSGIDVAEILGITKYEPPIPTGMSGEVANLFGSTVRYDFERIESVPDIFEIGEPVVASEKLHGSFCCIRYVPNLNHPEMFGSNGDILVHSKGLGAQGLAFKNNESNNGNIYVQTIRGLILNGFDTKIRTVVQELAAEAMNASLPEMSVAILGEVYGRGVQDLHYGLDKPGFRVFDILLGDNTWATKIGMLSICERLGLEMVPELYVGPFDLAALEKVRNGKTMLGGDNVREGIVVRSSTEATHPYHGRKIAKMISQNYLLRKSKDATEYN